MVDMKIIGLYVPDYSREYSIREMIADLSLNYPNTFKRIKTLIKSNVLIEKKARNISKITFNVNNADAISLLSFVEQQQIIKLNQIIKTISHEDPFACIGLFGSRASRKAKKDSDWDVFIISSDRQRIEKLSKTFPLDKDVNFEIFSADEFKESLVSSEENVVKHIVKNKRLLYNPYPFYSIIREWEMKKYAPSQNN
jgi:predicted nucleotidyltransferase